MRKLWKTTIVIWSDENPTNRYELIDMAKEATDGVMYCSSMQAVEVEDPEKDAIEEDRHFTERGG